MDGTEHTPEQPQAEAAHELADDLAAALRNVADEVMREVEPLVECRMLDRWPTGSRHTSASSAS